MKSVPFKNFLSQVLAEAKVMEHMEDTELTEIVAIMEVTKLTHVTFIMEVIAVGEVTAIVVVIDNTITHQIQIHIV